PHSTREPASRPGRRLRTRALSTQGGFMSTKKAKKKGSPEAAPQKVGRKDYDAKLAKLHEELVHLQEWVKREGLKVCIVFEGRDGAGKGGTIKALTERVSPRVFRVVAL